MPQPVQLDYDLLAAEYARSRRLHPEVLRRLLGRAGAANLEVGCGTGNYISALAEATGAACWGIDPSEAMLAAGRRACERVRFQSGRAERLPFPAATFDLVFSVDVIHHVGDRPAFWGEARRVLRAGGRLCTVTDSEWVIRHRVPLTSYFPETVEVELRRYPPIPTLWAEMARAGFCDAGEDLVEWPYALTDAQPYRDKAFSSLHLIAPEAHARGLTRMEADLRAGPIECVSRYVLLWVTRPPN